MDDFRFLSVGWVHGKGCYEEQHPIAAAQTFPIHPVLSIASLHSAAMRFSSKKSKKKKKNHRKDIYPCPSFGAQGPFAACPDI